MSQCNIKSVLKSNYNRLFKLFQEKKFSFLLKAIDDLLIKFVRDKQPYDRFKIYTPYDKQTPINISYMGDNFFAAMMPKIEYHISFLNYLKKENISLIVQLNKCSTDYFEEYLIEEIICSYFIIKKYRFNIEKIYFPNWPDFGLPDKNKFDELISEFRKIKGDRKIVVHCLAGVGRTGTFIFHELLAKYRQKDEKVFFDLFLEMRSKRYGMIQTEEQFKFNLTNFN